MRVWLSASRPACFARGFELGERLFLPRGQLVLAASQYLLRKALVFQLASTVKEVGVGEPEVSLSLISEAESRELSIFAYASGSTNRILAGLVRRFGIGTHRTMLVARDRGQLDKV